MGFGFVLSIIERLYMCKCVNVIVRFIGWIMRGVFELEVGLRRFYVK